MYVLKSGLLYVGHEYTYPVFRSNRGLCALTFNLAVFYASFSHTNIHFFLIILNNICWLKKSHTYWSILDGETWWDRTVTTLTVKEFMNTPLILVWYSTAFGSQLNVLYFKDIQKMLISGPSLSAPSFLKGLCQKPKKTNSSFPLVIWHLLIHNQRCLFYPSYCQNITWLRVTMTTMTTAWSHHSTANILWTYYIFFTIQKSKMKRQAFFSNVSEKKC